MFCFLFTQAGFVKAKSCLCLSFIWGQNENCYQEGVKPNPDTNTTALGLSFAIRALHNNKVQTDGVTDQCSDSKNEEDVKKEMFENIKRGC